MPGFSKKDLPTWVDFINLMRFGMPLEGIAANCGVSHPTAFERGRRVFEADDGYQDRIVLRDRVRIDGACINDTTFTVSDGAHDRPAESRQELK
ncbi:hypothetical protein [Olsenella urininfantis]|uniref:hypothetical protein n=1 Tax=Olsenella urininfantis TaxID=1871033 RepID=UPI000985BBCB|nr:hypothetical protein [Olsenella urininfantis]